MKFREYYLSLDDEQREAYAKRAGTSPAYLPQLAAENPFKVPKEPLMRKLAEASEGRVTLPEVLDHFYSKPRIRGPRRNAASNERQL